MSCVIETYEISKYFGKLKAVDNVSISVKKDEIYGFLGLNGAGKTTLIRMLLGMINPTKGYAIINGEKILPGEVEIWKNVGYLVEIPFLYPELTVKENLEIFYKLYLVENKNSINDVIKKLNLSNYSHVKVKHLSQGNLQRLGIAKALLHNPDILILDEPINGLDPAGIVEIRGLLKDLSLNHNKTIFISSHILEEISKLADKIGIIHEGKLLKEINESQLQKELIKKLIIKTRDNNKALNLLISQNIRAQINNEYIEKLITIFLYIF